MAMLRRSGDLLQGRRLINGWYSSSSGWASRVSRSLAWPLSLIARPLADQRAQASSSFATAVGVIQRCRRR